ncbi:hypothetical protein NPIL_102091 [Nephila pilipes]|uniref:Uncharacterized protein n=1 Tax=Nephila pilipes TaxID=299642 RepID=A0A8X6PDP1_NEPPI|nr:hypothetical protein NPIL_102091 [Nephila pilipes]
MLDYILHRSALNLQMEEPNLIKNNLKSEMDQVTALKTSLTSELELLKNQIRIEILNSTNSYQPGPSDDGFTTKTRRKRIKSKAITQYYDFYLKSTENRNVHN